MPARPERVLDRRDFLALAAKSAAALPLLRAPGALPVPAPAPRARLERIGIQLHSLRRLLAEDFAGTLARVAEIGYREVELAGWFGLTPAQVRGALMSAGLRAPAVHVPFPRLGRRFEEELDAAGALDARWVVVAWVPRYARRSLADWSRLAERFDAAGERARARGLRFGFHNHDYELETVEGRIPLELLLESTDPERVDFEMDLYWVVKGGGDPTAILAAHPGRFRLLHLKDSSGPPFHRMVDVGAGVIDFGAILEGRAEAGFRHWFVEHDDPPDPMAFAAASWAHLREIP